MRLPSRFRKSFVEEFVERLQVLKSPILPRPNFAQILPDFHEAHIALLFFCVFSIQYLIDMVKDKRRPPAIKVRMSRYSESLSNLSRCWWGCRMSSTY